MLDLLHLLKLGLVVVLTYVAVTVLFPPIDFPKSIPTIPFYVSFLGTYTNMDQREIYERYLKAKLANYGAVKIYFASRWNILVTKPSYLNQVFRYEDIYAKSGNQKKIPYAVLSKYTGDNVISAHGEVWRLYRSVITKGIQFPDRSCVKVNCDKLVKLIDFRMDGAQKKTFAVSDFLQRFALANIAESMLGYKINTLELESESELHTKLKFVKSQIFKPLFMNFPILDILPIQSRIKALREVESFRKYFSDQVKAAQNEENADRGSAAFKLYTALQNGKITESQFIDNVMIIIIAGHENPQLFMTSLLYIIAKYPELQSQLRSDISNLENLEEAALLNATLFETLRYLPPLGQIINRKTTKDTILGGHHIPKDVYVGYNNFASGRDVDTWGPDADEFKVERWGKTNEEILQNYKLAKSNASLASFHGGKRACLGERFALFESRLFVKAILENYEVRIPDEWEDRITPAGPICPFMLKIEFRNIEKLGTLM